MKKTKFDIYQMITDRIVGGLENGVIPWQKKWDMVGGVNTPMNFASKRPYNGINALMLGLSSYNTPWFLTYKQAEKLGGYVKKGEKSLPVIFWKWYFYDADGKPCDESVAVKKIPNARYYKVFNVEQTEGIDWQSELKTEEKPENTFTPIEACENIWDQWTNKPPVNYGGNRACYYPVGDRINMPEPTQFHSSENFYATLFHEGIHATGHGTRLNREEVVNLNSFGNHAYSKEELTAEIGAAFLCGITGIEHAVIENQSAYINGWLSKLKGDKKFVYEASKKAKSAVEHILK
jgi:antirestriction protein ArdC